MNRKGVELAMNTIIIAIIVLVVMGVVLYIFRGVFIGSGLGERMECSDRMGGEWECIPQGSKAPDSICMPGGNCQSGFTCCRVGDG